MILEPGQEVSGVLNTTSLSMLIERCEGGVKIIAVTIPDYPHKHTLPQQVADPDGIMKLKNESDLSEEDARFLKGLRTQNTGELRSNIGAYMGSILPDEPSKT